MSTQRNYTPETGMLPVWGFSDKIRKARDITGPFPTRAGAALDRERLAPVTTLSQKRGA